MRVSKRTEYALRAIIHLARLQPGQFVQSRDVARMEKLPNKFLESVLLGLKRLGYLESKVGSGGGYRLARKSSSIAIGELLRALEEKDRVDPSLPKDAMPGEIALKLIEDRLAAAHSQLLDKLSLEKLVEEVNAKSAQRDEMFYI